MQTEILVTITSTYLSLPMSLPSEKEAQMKMPDLNRQYFHIKPLSIIS